MPKSRRTASASSAQRITTAIIEKLEEGTKPWVKPWRGLPVSRPLRSCGTSYRGMNTFWLWMVADACGYASPYWMTYRQCRELGGQVRKGEKSTIAIFYKSYTKEVENAEGEVILHAPVTSGSEHDSLPLGEWKVTGIQKDPTFHYNPALFGDGNPAHAKAKIAAGPNNPVGVVWIAISKEHYGLHGTPEPGRIGYAQSHGCVRLTNWDAQRVAALVQPGTRVIFR